MERDSNSEADILTSWGVIYYPQERFRGEVPARLMVKCELFDILPRLGIGQIMVGEGVRDDLVVKNKEMFSEE